MRVEKAPAVIFVSAAFGIVVGVVIGAVLNWASPMTPDEHRLNRRLQAELTVARDEIRTLTAELEAARRVK